MELPEQVPGPVDPERVQLMWQSAQAPPVQPTIHWMPIMTPCGTTGGQTQPARTSVPSTGYPR
jgi:hypothetical protein